MTMNVRPENTARKTKSVPQRLVLEGRHEVDGPLLEAHRLGPLAQGLLQAVVPEEALCGWGGSIKEGGGLKTDCQSDGRFFSRVCLSIRNPHNSTHLEHRPRVLLRPAVGVLEVAPQEDVELEGAQPALEGLS